MPCQNQKRRFHPAPECHFTHPALMTQTTDRDRKKDESRWVYFLRHLILKNWQGPVRPHPSRGTPGARSNLVGDTKRSQLCRVDARDPGPAVRTFPPPLRRGYHGGAAALVVAVLGVVRLSRRVLTPGCLESSVGLVR
jgi:hypothetical protein